MVSKIGLPFFAGALLVAGCGQGAENQQASTPADAERPYAEAAAPPSHVDEPTLAESQPDAAPDPAAFREAAANIGAESGKVDNVTATVANDTDAVKDIAIATASDASDENSDDPFGGLVGDADRGRRLFAQCQACHALIEGQNRAGPTLYNIVGSPAGAVEGFRYSDANANADIIWTEDALFAYLEDPAEYIPGTRMFYPGVAKPQDRADIIAFLKTHGD